MHDATGSATGASDLRAGQWVEVRGAAEILATLDGNGRIDGMPFMPEMLQYCGKRFRVWKSAHKTCDTIKTYRNRSVDAAVHLEELRCDGAAHGGCEQVCLLFWKTAWLKPVDSGAPAAAADPPSPDGETARRLDALQRQVSAPVDTAGGDKIRYVCQATELLDFTKPIDWWDPRPYVKDLRTGNVTFGTFIYYAGIALFNMIWRRLSRNPSYPYRAGNAREDIPGDALNLRAGDLVEVRSRDEIVATLDAQRNYRGLSFDVEMEPFCGKTFRVLKRVEKLVDERTGKLLRVKRDSIILDGAICGGCLSRNRMFCPRAIYPFWRERWLKRVS